MQRLVNRISQASIRRWVQPSTVDFEPSFNDNGWTLAMLPEGIYESIINHIVSRHLSGVDRERFFISDAPIEKADAAVLLSQYLGDVTRRALSMASGDDRIARQIELANKIIRLIADEFGDMDFQDDIIAIEARILRAIFKKLDSGIVDFESRLREVVPYTGLSHSELFTGSNVGISLESEIKKEILSANKIDLLVAFIRWTGIRIFERELREFTSKGGSLRVITTSYLGSTDFKAVEFLSGLPNTQVKISFNTDAERLHAKAYLFSRDTGFHTGYIGSSNISRSALTTGLEWNLKITTREIPHVIDKFSKTFETYWMDREFELFEPEKDREKLITALNKEAQSTQATDFRTYFDLRPYQFQQEILEKLEVERTVHGRNRNLIVAATGTGKTLISAFDFKRFREANPESTLLFVAHRKEILQQAQATYQGVLRDNNFGQLWVDGHEPSHHRHLFASVQTLYSRLEEFSRTVSSGYYDYIVVDEVHHIAADTYRPILERFSSKVLLGLTATPERMDNADILADFCGTVAAEIRLPEALNRKLLSPFQYFGISDNVDLSSARWENGGYVKSELTALYTKDDKRVGKIIQDLHRYLVNPHATRTLGFCVTQAHAQYMCEKFNQAGLASDYLVSSTSDRRNELRRRLRNKEINYLFVVDIFNEGVDIPEIDTVLFLRPTESLTVFLQQLGRGLRLADGKECLTVLDFVGNSRPEYDYEGKFRALIGQTNTATVKELEDDFPHLPAGCSIVLEEKAKEYILDNIRQATALRRSHLVTKIRNFRHQTTQPLTLKNFVEFHRIPVPAIYKKACWARLCFEADVEREPSSVNEDKITRTIAKKWLACNSESYFRFIVRCAQANFDVDLETLSPEEKIMCLMLHYDVWGQAGGFSSLQESIRAIGLNRRLNEEIVEVLTLLEDRVGFLEHDVDLGYPQPLKVHGRYTREQILAAFGLSTFASRSSNREGNAIDRRTNTELLFITLDKSEGMFSPTTLYEDFAISPTEFHWQTHNAAGPHTERGKNYIHHEERGRQILLFVRERNVDEHGTAMGSVFLGRARLKDHSGSKPMSIKWQLEIPMPAFLWTEAAKMAIG